MVDQKYKIANRVIIIGSIIFILFVICNFLEDFGALSEASHEDSMCVILAWDIFPGSDSLFCLFFMICV